MHRTNLAGLLQKKPQRLPGAVPANFQVVGGDLQPERQILGLLHMHAQLRVAFPWPPVEVDERPHQIAVEREGELPGVGLQEDPGTQNDPGRRSAPP